jgi:hypothetical protein
MLPSSNADPDREVANLDSLRAIMPVGVLFASMGRRWRWDDIAAFSADVPNILFDCDTDLACERLVCSA